MWRYLARTAKRQVASPQIFDATIMRIPQAQDFAADEAAMTSLFSLPSELLLSSIYSSLPCREQQARSLATLISVSSAPSRNIIIHGLEATGKTAITRAVLEKLSSGDAQQEDATETTGDRQTVRYAIIKSIECIGGRHLLEQTVGSIAKAVRYKGVVGRCENLSQLAVETAVLLEDWARNNARKRFVLVFDGVDHQRESQPTLIPALARLSELIPSLTTIFIVTRPPPHFLHNSSTPHIFFPSYTKAELFQILTLTTPPALPPPHTDVETHAVWTRFTAAIYDSLSKHSGRDILSFHSVCLRLWPQFIKPIVDGTHSPTPFSRLLLANRSLFQSENVLIPQMLSSTSTTTSTLPPQTQSGLFQNAQGSNSTNKALPSTSLTTHPLPFYSRLLLIAAYLSSYNPPRTDITFFTRSATLKRRKKGGGTALARTTKPAKNRKISRKLLGPQAFVLERMLAIFSFLRSDVASLPGPAAMFSRSRSSMSSKSRIRGRSMSAQRKGEDAVSGSADIQMAIATLASLRLLVRVGSLGTGDVLDGAGRWRVAVGWEGIRAMGRSVGVEVEEFLAE